MIKYRILDVLIFIGIAYAIWYFTGLSMVEYAIGFFIGYLIFVIGPIAFKINV